MISFPSRDEPDPAPKSGISVHTTTLLVVDAPQARMASLGGCVDVAAKPLRELISFLVILDDFITPQGRVRTIAYRFRTMSFRDPGVGLCVENGILVSARCFLCREKPIRLG